MIIRYNDDHKYPECLLSDTSLALNKLGRELQKVSDKRFYSAKKANSNGIYNSVLDGVCFELEDDDSDKIALNLLKSTFLISGNKTALEDLGEGLMNVFNEGTKAGTHIHYDYLDGYGLTRETNISLVISCISD